MKNSLTNLVCLVSTLMLVAGCNQEATDRPLPAATQIEKSNQTRTAAIQDNPNIPANAKQRAQDSMASQGR